MPWRRSGDTGQTVIERRTRYAMVGDDDVAYEAVGSASRHPVLIPAWWSNVEASWDVPPRGAGARAAGVARAAAAVRPARDGLSDPAPEVGGPFFERSTEDLLVVLDAGSQEAVLIGRDGGGPVAMLAASAYPARRQRQVPTLVIQRRGDRLVGLPHGRRLAQHIRRPVTLAGEDHILCCGDTGVTVSAPSSCSPPLRRIGLEVRAGLELGFEQRGDDITGVAGWGSGGAATA